MAEAAQTGVTVDNLNLLPDDDVPYDREEGEDCRHRSLTVDDQEGHMINLEAIGEIVHSCPAFIGMGDDNDFVASINELG